jgi:murein peptide amidase A
MMLSPPGLNVVAPPESARTPRQIKVSCDRPCRVSVRLTADDSAAVRVVTGRGRAPLLARAESAILTPAGGERAVRLSPTRVAHLLTGRQAGQLTATLTVTARDDAGNQRVDTRRIAIGADHPWRVVIGRSHAGRAIVARLPTGPADLLVVAAMHGSEGSSATLVATASRVVGNGLRAAVVTVANPDGLARRMRHNLRGVDLNRNFPTRDWGSAEAVAPGPAPASEPETRALIGLIRDLRPIQIVTVHAPLGLVEDPRRGPLATRLARDAGLPLVRSVGYPTPGSLGAWAAERGIPEVTLELPPGPPSGRMQQAAVGLFSATE